MKAAQVRELEVWNLIWVRCRICSPARKSLVFVIEGRLDLLLNILRWSHKVAHEIEPSSVHFWPPLCGAGTIVGHQ